jgi:ATP-dependent Clp protease ATP-binding subunit ClpB
VTPEFLNRIDDTIVFLPLTLDEIRQIVTIQLTALKNKLAKNNIDISFDDTAISLIAEKGYRPEYGGRPVKRAIKELVVDALSLALLRQEVSKTAPILVSAVNHQITIRN